MTEREQHVAEFNLLNNLSIELDDLHARMARREAKKEDLDKVSSMLASVNAYREASAKAIAAK